MDLASSSGKEGETPTLLHPWRTKEDHPSKHCDFLDFLKNIEWMIDKAQNKKKKLAKI
jgi:hypothetical protein